MMQDPNLVRAVLRSDLYCFIQAVFPIVSPGAPFAPNWHIEAIAHQLTRVLEGEISRLIITVPPLIAAENALLADPPVRG